VQDKAAHDPIGMILELLFILQWVSEFSERLETALESSKCMLYPHTNLKGKIRKNQKKSEQIRKSQEKMK
jgi:hypothetical protein